MHGWRQRRRGQLAQFFERTTASAVDVAPSGGREAVLHLTNALLTSAGDVERAVASAHQRRFKAQSLGQTRDRLEVRTLSRSPSQERLRHF